MDIIRCKECGYAGGTHEFHTKKHLSYMHCPTCEGREIELAKTINLSTFLPKDADDVYLNFALTTMSKCVDSNGEPNLIDVICKSNGWNPLEKGEAMTVHFHGKCYKVSREE